MEEWNPFLEILKNTMMLHLTQGGSAKRIIDMAFYGFFSSRLDDSCVLRMFNRRA